MFIILFEVVRCLKALYKPILVKWTTQSYLSEPSVNNASFRWHLFSMINLFIPQVCIERLFTSSVLGTGDRRYSGGEDRQVPFLMERAL